MKYTMHFFAAALMTAALALSCNKTVEDPSQKQINEPVIRTFTCTIGDPDSKVAIDTDGKTTWEVDDEILIHGEYMGVKSSKNYSTIVKLKAGDISADGKTATISFATDSEGVSGIVPYTRSGISTEFYAAYPASSVKQTSGHHCYYCSVFTDCSKPLLAGYNKGDSFVFYNLGSVISFSIPNTEDFDSYVFTGESGETVSYDQFSIKAYWTSTDTEEYKLPYTSSDEYSQTSYGSVGENTSITGTVTCDGSLHKIFIPNGANFANGFRINFLKSGVIKKYVSVKAVDLRMDSKKGKYLPLGDISSHLITYVPPTSHDSSITPVPTDDSAANLSKTASANCYIVDGSDTDNEGKIFKFKAVKGNSSVVLSAIESAEIIWETYNNATTVTLHDVIVGVDYDLQEGKDPYIVFQMPATLHAGNALIAAKDGEDNIIWSWHIWVPETSVQEEDYSAESFMTPKMLDRNLGALRVTVASTTANAPESFGLMYQWGRKDPFMGPSAAGTSTVAKVVGTSYTRASGHISAEAAIANPTKFGKGTNATLDGDWLDTSDSDRWGGESLVKTINDPCPAGYRVPRATEGKLFSDDNGLSAYTGYGYDKDYYWFKVGSFVAPLASYYDYDGYVSSSGAGTRAIIWSATSHYNPSTKGDYANAHYVYYESGADHSVNWTQRKARAASVRCVAE